MFNPPQPVGAGKILSLRNSVVDPYTFQIFQCHFNTVRLRILKTKSTLTLSSSTARQLFCQKAEHNTRSLVLNCISPTWLLHVTWHLHGSLRKIAHLRYDIVLILVQEMNRW